jgi:D-alanyl-D-alanine carboxypeptidase
VDPDTSEVLFQDGADVLRTPASVMKLLSTTSALRTLGPDKSYATTISSTDKPNKFLLLGESDPWLTTSAKDATRLHRGYLPYLINKALQTNPKLKAISLQYKNIYFQDIEAIQAFYKGKLKIYPHQISDASIGVEEIAKVTSPRLSEIIDYTLLWSDNTLAARLAFQAAKAQGFTADSPGLQKSMEKMMNELSISANGLIVKDGAGLSHDTRISARIVASLLTRIRNDPTLALIHKSLPTSGVSGTLRHRYITTAPEGVGLIQAKTGWINSTVSLAGYVTAGEKELVFAVIVDHLANKESLRQSARVAIDKMLASLAKPAPLSLPVLTTPVVDTATV